MREISTALFQQIQSHIYVFLFCAVYLLCTKFITCVYYQCICYASFPTFYTFNYYNYGHLTSLAFQLFWVSNYCLYCSLLLFLVNSFSSRHKLVACCCYVCAHLLSSYGYLVNLSVSVVVLRACTLHKYITMSPRCPPRP